MRWIICLLTLAVLAPQPVPAAQWNVVDLGRLYKEHHCMSAARQTFEGLRGYAQVGSVRDSDWVMYADGIEGMHDALITCTYGDNRGTRATLVIHSESRPVDAHLLMRRIAHMFETRATMITKAWKDSFN